MEYKVTCQPDTDGHKLFKETIIIQSDEDLTNPSEGETEIFIILADKLRELGYQIDSDEIADYDYTVEENNDIRENDVPVPEQTLESNLNESEDKPERPWENLGGAPR